MAQHRCLMVRSIAFYCATYRRPELLEEALACFLAQDFLGEKKLVIVNDEPRQELVFDHPEVLIINADCRMPLSVKLNYAIGLCYGAELLFPMDDDDLFAPWRATSSITGMRGYAYKTDEFVLDTDPMRLVRGRNLGNYAFSPLVAYRYGDPYHSDNAHPYSDVNLMTKIDHYMSFYGMKTKRPAKPHFLYRKHHGRQNYSSLHRRHHVAERWDIPFVEGRINLEPRNVLDFNDLQVSGPAVKINEVDNTYSDVDLQMFYNGMEE